MNKFMVSLIAITLLSGCKVELAPTVNLSDVQSETAKTVQSKILIEVSSCTDFKDSRQESSTLIKAKNEIQKIFADAKYIECYREKMDSKAVFEIPIMVGGKTGNGDIQIRNNKSGGMVVEISKKLEQKISNHQNSTFRKINTSISINVNNDLNQSQQIIGYAIYLDNNAIPVSKYDLKPGQHTIKLSDVSVSAILTKGSALVYENANDSIDTKN